MRLSFVLDHSAFESNHSGRRAQATIFNLARLVASGGSLAKLTKRYGRSDDLPLGCSRLGEPLPNTTIKKASLQ